MTKTGFHRLTHQIDEKFKELFNRIEDLEARIKTYSYKVDGHPEPTFKDKNFGCYEQNAFKENQQWFPHLYHTDNAQLNNITDMIAYGLKNCCCKGGKDYPKPPVIDLEQLKVPEENIDECRKKIQEIINNLDKDDKESLKPLDQLREILDKLESLRKKKKKKKGKEINESSIWRELKQIDLGKREFFSKPKW